ncbi:IS66 family insertion sequence element accessory protein TnpB [Salmonella enterica subsp. enterica serovar Gatineau]|uniref:IS66 family insertion sequence element accessory protein TnpA n=1 Tax=Salmonella enterica TaxID=28901 RepID=UPI002866F559|nr:IS66 family insertion sequence element accessory protein TnpB [Salmonella enterica]MDR7937704.1 IS66 family insertion sequence element accessory protein TnpB [Salmonella enterica subsp. enterica serovar Gatineau]
MPLSFWSTDDKKHHVRAWRDSGLTSRQYALKHNINPGYFKNWSSMFPDSKNQPSPAIIPVRVTPAPSCCVEIVTLHLPGGCHISCLPAQLADVLRAVKHADA